MAQTFTSMSSLKEAIKKEMKNAMDECTKKSFADAQINTTGFYKGGEPKVYKRTGQFGRSPRVQYPYEYGDNIHSSVYLDDDYEYKTGTYSTHKVFEEAEKGTSGIVGIPGTWERTLEDIEENIKQSFGKRFK